MSWSVKPQAQHPGLVTTDNIDPIPLPAEKRYLQRLVEAQVQYTRPEGPATLENLHPSKKHTPLQ